MDDQKNPRACKKSLCHVYQPEKRLDGPWGIGKMIVRTVSSVRWKNFKRTIFKSGNVLLVLDNAASHSCPENLEQEDKVYSFLSAS